MIIPGRSCPLDYLLPKEEFQVEPIKSCNTLYVVGGVYGNPFALMALKEVIKDDINSFVVLNGDIHWFDSTYKDFMNTEKMCEDYLCLLGNVEAELKRNTNLYAGCGCAYPSSVSDDIVNRSNAIHDKLKKVITDDIKDLLNKRLSTAIIKVSDEKVAVTHGDEKFLAGWECSREALLSKKRQVEVNNWLKLNSISVLATTHTCAPVAISLSNGIIINNGSAGMPNFKNELYGLITRISTTKHPDALYRKQIRNIFVEGIPLKYDNESFIKWFDNIWPLGSPAEISYRNRIVNGPDDSINNVILDGFYKL